MRLYRYLIILCLATFISSCGFGTSKKPTIENALQEDYQWERTDSTLALLNKEGDAIWKLNFSKNQDKPYFHPLRTPKGHNLTLERPKDHPWHRGLWFSWKDINGVNYWEEDPEKGIAEGRSIIKSVDIDSEQDFSAKIVLTISYEEDQKPVIDETRTLVISSPVQKNEYTIKWEQSFKILEEAVLYLEKPAKHGGVGWGGYAGLSFRGSDLLTDQHFTSSSGWENFEDLTGYGEKERWMDMTAKVIGTNDYAGLTIYDAPSNPRYPSPYYIWFAKGQHTFFTPSLLFDGPMTLIKGESFLLDYLILIHDGKKSIKEFESYAIH